jgi:ketosteroid isomerase-like protein
MNTKQIADRLVELCRKGEFEKAQKELFSEDAVSIEPHATPAFPKETKGLQAILEKGEKWNSMQEKFYGVTVSKPLVAGETIALSLTLDFKMKDRERMNNPEIAIYHVKDGKIISEEFFR